MSKSIGPKIVGHRGVKGLEHENTIKGFKLAKSLGLDAVEFDTIPTRDGKFVVVHDDDLQKLTGKKIIVTQTDYADLAEIKLANGETIPLLYDVLSLLRGTAVVLDIKTDKHLPELFAILDHFADMDITVTSWQTPWVSTEFKKQRPHIPAFVERYYIPIGALNSVRRRKADGLNMFYWWLNPVTYYLACRRGKQIQVYTVNNVFVARMIRRFYPDVWICTNNPHLLKKALKQ